MTFEEMRISEGMGTKVIEFPIRCICTQECDCENPPPDDTAKRTNGIYHVSNECPVHNFNPDPNPECLIHGSIIQTWRIPGQMELDILH